MKRPVKSSTGASVPLPRGDDPIATSYPLLYAHLADETWDDGTSRVTSTLFLFMEGYRWKCMFKDRNESQIAFYTAHTLDELFCTIEGHLAHDAVDWKRDRKPAGRGR